MTYQWLSNGVPILEATNDSFSLANLPVANSTNFSVVISNVSGSITSAPAAIWVDSNANAMPDWWETQYFGNLNQSPAGDFDGDGVSNLDEYREGTNPTNGTSFNRRLSFRTAYGRVILSPNRPYYTNGESVTLTAVPDGGQSFLGWSGAIVSTQTVVNLSMSSHKTVVAAFGLPLPVALNDTNLVWVTGGTTPWSGQTQISYDGVGAAQSGKVSDNQQSTLQFTTNLTQSAQLGFWWKVSSQPPDALIFQIDAPTVASISGESIGWQHFVTNVSVGTHTFLWRYSKNALGETPTGIPFADAGWLDQVTLTLLPTPPIITTQPSSQSISAGSDAFFSVGLVGTPPFAYQWVFNGSNLIGGTNSAVTVTNVVAGIHNCFVIVTNSFGSTTSQVATLFAFPATPITNCYSPPPGLVGWWRGGSNAFDAFSTNNAVLFDGATYAQGKVGTAFHLPGGTSHLEINNPAVFNFGVTAPITVELWAYRTGSASVMHILSKRSGCGAMNYQMAFDAGGVGFGSTSGGAGTGPAWQLPLNSWTHLAGTFDGSTFRFYTNGVLAGTGGGTLGTTSGDPLKIGAAGTCGQMFVGMLDEVAIYNRALTADEIANIYYVGAAGKCTSPPSIITQPSNQIVFTSATAHFTLGVLGTRPMAYQWYFNQTNPVAGGDNTTLTLSNVNATLGGPYFAVVSNAYGVATSIVATLTIPDTNCFNPPVGLFGWWPGHSNTLDAFGTNNAALVNGAGYSTGRVGSAFSFSGNSYLEISNSSAFNFGSTSPLTIELWAYRTGSAGVMHILGKRDGCGGSGIGYQMAFDASGIGFGNFSGAGFTTWQLPLNTWTHLAGTFDGSTFRFYTNGVLAGSGTGALGPATSTPLRIGGSGSCSAGFVGLLDEVAVYKRALSASEIASIYYAGSLGKCPILNLPFGFDTSPAGLNWTSAGLQLRLNGLKGQNSVVIYASTNLANWLPIFTNPPVIGSIQYLDSNATNAQARFYRAGLVP